MRGRCRRQHHRESLGSRSRRRRPRLAKGSRLNGIGRIPPQPVTGYVAGADWKLDLDDLTGVFIRYLGREGRAPLHHITKDGVPALYQEFDSGLMALLEDLPCPVINRLRAAFPTAARHRRCWYVSVGC